MTLSLRISYTQIPHDQDFPQRGNTRDNLYKSFMYKLSKFYRKIYNKFYGSFVFPRTLYPKKSNLESLRSFISPPRNFDPITADPKFYSYRESSSITDFLEILWRFYSSYMNRSDSKVKNLHPYPCIRISVSIQTWSVNQIHVLRNLYHPERKKTGVFFVFEAKKNMLINVGSR